MALIRPVLLSGLVYLAYRIAYPDGDGSLYHAMAPALIAGGAVGLWFLKKILDLGSDGAKFGLEAAFVAVVAVGLGYTMPQTSGKAPLTQFMEGARPNRDAARRGFKKIGVDPDGGGARTIVNLFPR